MFLYPVYEVLYQQSVFYAHVLVHSSHSGILSVGKSDIYLFLMFSYQSVPESEKKYQGKILNLQTAKIFLEYLVKQI